MKKTQRLDKILANQGLGTRKDIKKLLKEGTVTVNGQVAKDGALQVEPESDTILIGSRQLQYREFLYLMMHKPAGVVSATWDPRDQTVLDLLPDEYKGFELFPVGRLDKDTEGLLLLTNDGQLAHNLLSPKKHVPKIYEAKVEGRVNENDILLFKEGVTLDDGYRTMPAELVILSVKEEAEEYLSHIELTIAEGKFHQVKRMFEAVGKKVTYLKRIQMGSLELDPEVTLGQVRELTVDELKELK